jgi:hypothetical protein
VDQGNASVEIFCSIARKDDFRDKGDCVLRWLSVGFGRGAGGVLDGLATKYATLTERRDSS